MGGILLFSHSGFSDTEANGITMKNLLAAWQAEEKAEFYCNVSAPDFTAAHRYFRVTDMQMLKAFFGKKSKHIYTYPADDLSQGTASASKTARKIPLFLKKQKYNFGIKWMREILWSISPWGHRKSRRWIQKIAPQAIVYMVGESLFMDGKVEKACKQLGVPLVLYNCEAYRIIDLKSRKGLERAYYRRCQKRYAKLQNYASLIIYNSPMLQAGYEERYPKKARTMIAYNSAKADFAPYESKKDLKITYFGNLGVGRTESLLIAAEILSQIAPTTCIDVYGVADAQIMARFDVCRNICYHGFLQQEQLHEIIEQSDILLHVESFDQQKAQKLRYAFSTKIAQCLCAGRCLVSFAPEDIASTQYLRSVGMPTATNRQELETILQDVIHDVQRRKAYAALALEVGLRNHQTQTVRDEIGAICK